MGAGRDIRSWAEVDPVVRRTREEAAGAGATLHYDGEGGVDSGLALHVYRRDGWACRMCGTQDDLELDHIDGHPSITPDIPDAGGEDTAENLAVVCHSCQDALHDADRMIESGA